MFHIVEYVILILQQHGLCLLDVNIIARISIFIKKS